MKRIALRLLSQPTRRQISDLARQIIHPEHHAQKQSWPNLSASELLRFALTGSTELGHARDTKSSLPEHLRGLFQAEWILSNPPPALWSSLKRNLPEKDDELVQALEGDITDISTLRTVIEKHVNDAQRGMLLQSEDCSRIDAILRRCQHKSHADVLLAVDDIIARLQRLEVHISPRLYEIGMRYAMSTLSAPALRRFLDGHCSVGSPRLSPHTSSSIFGSCLQALHEAVFENPTYDPKLVLAAITGEGESSFPSGPKLHDILGLTGAAAEKEVFRLYLCCLVRLQSEETLHNVWGHAVKELLKNGGHTSLYYVVLELIQSGRSQTALKFLTDISQHCGDNLPRIGRLQHMRLLLDDAIVGEALPDLVRGQDYLELLDSALCHVEKSLGLVWRDDSEYHHSEGHDTSWNMSQDRPLFTIDGDCAGFDNLGRLFEEIKTYGHSTSPTGLGRIVDLLNTYDGHAYQLPSLAFILDFFPTKKNGKLKPLSIRWRPQHSPIEFSNSRPPIPHDSFRPWTPSALGLIRARVMVNGVPQPGPSTLHLMQLGSLEVQYEHEAWERTPYILAWDRREGRMVCFYVGKNDGVIDPGPIGLKHGFKNMAIVVQDLSWGFRPAILETASTVSPRRKSFYLDVDPSPDLGF